jgi:hypothetical protein
MQRERKANREGPIDGAHRFGSPTGLGRVQQRMRISKAIR